MSSSHSHDQTRIGVDQEVCIQCGACVAFCIVGVFDDVDGMVDVVAPEECWMCGHCVAGCPVDAITHMDYPLEACPSTRRFPEASVDGLVGAFRARRSVRTYLDKTVPRALVQELIELARWVPSVKNSQPVDWVAIDDRDRIAELSALTVEVLAPKEALQDGEADDSVRLARQHARGEDPIFYGAPVVLIAHLPASIAFARDHAAYAVYNVMLTVEPLGLGTCLIGYLNAAVNQSLPLAQELGLPEGRRVGIAITLGYRRHRFYRVIARRPPRISWNPLPVGEEGGS